MLSNDTQTCRIIYELMDLLETVGLVNLLTNLIVTFVPLAKQRRAIRSQPPGPRTPLLFSPPNQNRHVTQAS